MPAAVPSHSPFLTSLALACALVTAAQTSAAPAPKTSISHKYGQLPISFEINRGQTDERVKFIARGRGYGLFLTGQEAVLTLHTSQPAAPDAGVIRMQLSGANPSAQPVGVDPLPGTANYLIGRDSSKWHTGIPTYSKARFSGVYPGVDVVYYGNQSQLEFDFVVAPHADPRAIQLRFSGLNPKLTAAGDLSIAAGESRIAFHKPVIYQEANGRRQQIPGRFLIDADNSVRFSLGIYDHSQPLIIDPVLGYATYLGGSLQDTANAIAVDSSGNAYVAGYTSSTDFPITPGAFQTELKPGAEGNAFVSKLDTTGTTLLYSTYLGGSVYDEADAVAVDSAGNTYITGSTGSKDFPVTAGAFQTAANPKAHNNVFVTKLDASGAGLVYSTYLGGSGGYYADGDHAAAIALDAAGNAYVAGSTFSSDFPVTPGAFQTVLNGEENAFLTKLDPTGTALVYSTYLGGSGVDLAHAIALDSSDHAYVAGNAGSFNFPVTPGAFQTAFIQPVMAFVTKFDSTGAALVYSTYLGGHYTYGGGDVAYAIAVDKAGAAYVAGSTTSINFPVTPGAFQTKSTGSRGNAFVTKLDATGGALLYSTYLGGHGNYFGDFANAIAVNSFGVAYVAGATGSYDFPVTPDAFETRHPSQIGSTFVTRLNATGTALVYSTYLNGSDADYYGDYEAARGIALDGFGNAYVAGITQSHNFPVTPGAFQTVNKTQCCSRITGFVARFNVIPAATPTFSPAPGKYIGSVKVTINDNTSGSTIRYALPNANPTATSPIYTGPITISSGYVTVRAYADSSNNAPSAFARASYSIVAQTPEPVISPSSGSYAAGQKITITDANPKATIRYTTDGSTPTAKSHWYNGPVVLSSPETIRAIAISTNEDNSPVASASYTLH